MANYIVAMTGASGAAYGKRLVDVLASQGEAVHLLLSDAAKEVILQELGLKPQEFRDLYYTRDNVMWTSIRDIASPLASGTVPVEAMVVIPCSMGTLGHIATGAASNLIHRAADVCLKERRPLVLVPRETPLNVIHLENMERAAKAGAIILPAMPGFYLQPQSIDDLVDFLVAKVLDSLKIPHHLAPRYQQKRWNPLNTPHPALSPQGEREN